MKYWLVNIGWLKERDRIRLEWKAMPYITRRSMESSYKILPADNNGWAVVAQIISLPDIHTHTVESLRQLNEIEEALREAAIKDYNFIVTSAI